MVKVSQLPNYGRIFHLTPDKRSIRERRVMEAALTRAVGKTGIVKTDTTGLTNFTTIYIPYSVAIGVRNVQR